MQRKIRCKECDRVTKYDDGICSRCRNQKPKPRINTDYECMGGDKKSLEYLRKKF